MKKLHQIEKINFEGNYLTLLVNSKVYRFPIENRWYIRFPPELGG